MTVGQVIRKLRYEKGWTRERLANKVNLSPNYINTLERSKKSPPLRTLVLLAKALNVEVSTIISLTKKENEKNGRNI